MKRYKTIVLIIFLCVTSLCAQNKDLVGTTVIGVDSITIQCGGRFFGNFVFKGDEYCVRLDIYSEEKEYKDEITKNIMDSVLLPIDSVYIKNIVPVEALYNYTNDEIAADDSFFDTTIYMDGKEQQISTALIFNYGRWELELTPTFKKLYDFLKNKCIVLYNKFTYEKLRKEREERNRARMLRKASQSGN